MTSFALLNYFRRFSPRGISLPKNSVRDFQDFGNPKKNRAGLQDLVQIWPGFPDFRKWLSWISGFPGISKIFISTAFYLLFYCRFPLTTQKSKEAKTYIKYNEKVPMRAGNLLDHIFLDHICGYSTTMEVALAFWRVL